MSEGEFALRLDIFDTNENFPGIRFNFSKMV